MHAYPFPFAHVPLPLYASSPSSPPPQIADGYLAKYFASVTSLLVYAAPIYFQVRGGEGV